MTRILVPRGSAGGSSSSANRSSSSSSSTARVEPQVPTPQHLAVKDGENEEEIQERVILDELLEFSGSSESKILKNDHPGSCDNDNKERSGDEIDVDSEKISNDDVLGPRQITIIRGLAASPTLDSCTAEKEGVDEDPSQTASESSHSPPPPPPVPPPRPSTPNSIPRRFVSGSSNSVRIGSSRRSVPSTRTSPTGSHPSSPGSHVDNEGYNSADEQNPCFGSYYDDLERERQFEMDIRRVKGLEVKKMVADGNCLFRAVADQVYGDSDLYDLARQMCIDYMEHERDHFAQFITEGFTSYCKRKRRDKVYGNNVEIQAMSEMYNRPIHIYSYRTEPINIFHGSYNTDLPPIRLSYHHGNHYNSLVDPRRLTIGAGLGFSCLRGTNNVDRDQVKAAIKAQQDQQIDNALLAEGQFYSDLELTEKEIELMVMEASRAEYLANDMLKQQLGRRESSTSGAEPSSSGARPTGSEAKVEGRREHNQGLQEFALTGGMQMVLSMGFTYMQVMEAYSIFGDDADSMVCYLLETGSSSRRKGKATE